MKKIIVLLLSVVLSFSVWASGGQEAGSEQSELLILNWLSGSQSAVTDEIDAAFMAKYPNITIKKVNTSSGADDPRSGIKTSLLAGDQYDLVLNTWPSLEAELREQGMLAPLDSYWDKYDWSQYLNDSWRQLAGAEGKTWALYFMAGNRSGLWYRKDLMKQIGLAEEPRTWEEFKSMCALLKKEGIVPVSVGARTWAQTEWFENLLLKVGGTEAASKLVNREIPWDSDVVASTLKAWQELLKLGYFDEADVMFSGDWDAAVDSALRYKRSALTLMGSWVNTRAVTDYGLAPGTDFSFIQFPALNEEYADTMSIDGKSWVLMANAPNPDAAALYLDFITGPEGAAILAAHNFITPSNAAPLAEMSAEFRTGLQDFMADPSDSTIKKVMEKWESRARALY